MSDADEMDVDAAGAPDTSDAMTFRAQGNLKGKARSGAANLPVEAEDNLPWVEKYRPSTLSDVAGHKDVLATINKFVSSNRLPHLLLYGPPGTGKTSTILALARQIYGSKNMRQMVLELNASDDRGIDVVREQIKTFSSTKQIFNSFSAPTTNNTSHTNGDSISSSGPAKPGLAAHKLIILDEADALTAAAQMALRRIIEKYTANTRFAILANYTHKLSPALLSRCTRFRFSPLGDGAVRGLVERVVAEEGVRVEGEGVLDEVVRCSRGDMRRALNVLQACHAATLPLPRGDGGAAEEEEEEGQREREREVITTGTIYDCIATPHPSDVQMIRDTLLSTPDVKSCLQTLNQVKQTRGLALMDVVTALSEELLKLEVPAQTRVRWCEGLAEVEYRLSGGGSEVVQGGALVGVVREGVELMDKGNG